jgi:hypothetical protein
MDPTREAYWRRKLRRLRLEAEPIGEQVYRQLRATVGVTGVSVAIGMMFLAIFAAFGRPDVGAILPGVLLGPVVALAWLDFAILKARASRYSREKAASKATDAPPG